MMRLLWSAQFEFSWHNFDSWVTLIPGVYLQFVQIGHINWQSHENPVCFIHAVDMQFGMQGKIPTSNFFDLESHFAPCVFPESSHFKSGGSTTQILRKFAKRSSPSLDWVTLTPLMRSPSGVPSQLSCSTNALKAVPPTKTIFDGFNFPAILFY